MTATASAETGTVGQAAAGSPTRILVTGANGALGTIVRSRLTAAGYSVRSLVLVADPSAETEADTVVGSVADPAVAEQACDGMHGIVHLGGVSVPGHEWREYLDNNIDGTHTLLDAASRASIRRVALASSNHAAGYLRRGELPLSAALPPRPDSLYGVSKAAIEALGSFFADEFGLQTTSLRIGSCFPIPTTTRMLSTWLSADDLVRLVEASLSGPWQGHSTVWGISRNTRRWWSLTEGEAIGYFPRDDSEVYAADVTDSPNDYVGGAPPPAARG